MQSLIDLLRERAAAQPADTAFTFLDEGERPGAAMTWAGLDRRSRAIGAAIARRVEPGARVLVMLPPSLDFIPAFFGVLYAGAIAVPAYPPTGTRADRSAERLRGMIDDAGVTLVVGCGLDGALDPGTVADDLADDWRIPDVGASSVAFLQYTSGSTSMPRGVMVTHGNLLNNLGQTAADGGYGRDSVSVSWLPVNHDMGLINGLLQPVFSGFPAYLMAPAAFLQRPARWLHAISRLGATHSGGPNFAYDLCVRRVGKEEAATLDLSTWRVAYNGSEPVRRSTLERFQMRFGHQGFRWSAFSPAYGLAESTLLVTSVPAGVAPVFDGDAVASGVLPVASNVTIVDPVSRARCADGVTGEIWIEGASVAAGYWGRDQQTAETFRALTAEGHGPFLRSGDLGFVRSGCLFVTGRMKDVLIVRGVKHFPQDLEMTVETAHPAIRPGCCAAFAVEGDDDEDVAIVAEVSAAAARPDSPDPAQIVLAIRVAVAAVHHVMVRHVALLPPGTIPKTTSGKLQRFQCRDLLEAGTLNTIAGWSATLDTERAAS